MLKVGSFLCLILMTLASGSPAVPGSAHLKLAFDDNESLPSGVPQEMGFRIAKETSGYSCSQYQDAARAVVDEARAAGFSIDEQTLEMSFTKRDWSGGFGAYTETARGNRPAFTINMDTRKPTPIIASAELQTGITVSKTVFPAAVSGAAEFKGDSYVCAGRYIYKLTNWSSDPYFTLVFTHSDSGAVLRDMVVHDGVFYVAAGYGKAYAYTEDGSSWTESNRTGLGAYAEQFLTLNGMLHKTTAPASGENVCYHYQCVDGRNAGDDWAGPNQIGSSSNEIQMMVGVINNLVFCKDDGIYQLSCPNPNDPTSVVIEPIYDELKKIADEGNGWHAFVWNHGLVYPTLHGGLFLLKDRQIFDITPALQQERRLENMGNDSTFVGRIKAMAATPQYLFAQIQREADDEHRIAVCEEVNGVYTWRTLWDYDSDESDEMWITSISTDGPVLWSTYANSGSYFVSYWTLAAGPDPLQDSRMQFGVAATGGGTGYLYDPWLDMGLPTVPKRWASIELEAVGTVESGQTAMIRLVFDDTSLYAQKTLTLTTIPACEHYDLPYNFISRRMRVEVRLITDADNIEDSPLLIAYRVRAFAIPDPVRIITFTAEVPASGATWGLASQKEMRAFLNHVSNAQIPLTLTTPLEEEIRVIALKPYPMEQFLSPVDNGWDEAWTMRFIETPVEVWS